MIAELFYPKELKGIIADLRAKNDLNEEALKRFNNFINKTLKNTVIFYLLLSLILFHPKAGIEAALVILFVFFIAIAGFRYDLKVYVRKISNLYNYGSFINGKVQSYGTYKGVFGMCATFVFNGEEKNSSIQRIGAILNRKKYKKGDSIMICYHPNNPDYNVPFLQSLAQLFYLRKEFPNDI